MAYAENFYEGDFHSVTYGGHLHLVCVVCDVIFMFPNQRFNEVCWHNMHILLHALPLFYKLSALQVRISEESTLSATTQQFTTAKISGWALKQGIKTHSSLRQSNLQLQNEAALMSCRIRAVEHRKCAAGLAGADPGLRDRILQNYTRIKNARKLRRKAFKFCYVQKSSKLLVFLFPCWDIKKCLNTSVLNTAVFELVQQSIMLLKLVM